jgi:hypothetical protein
MDMLKDQILKIILDWTRNKQLLTSKSKNRNELKSSLEKIEGKLRTLKIENISILNASKDYYTVTYTLDNRRRIQQFKTEEIEA